jgi:hypothetical protein
MSKKSYLPNFSKYRPMILKISSQAQFWLLFLLSVSKLRNAAVLYPRFIETLWNHVDFGVTTSQFRLSEIVAQLKLYIPWKFHAKILSSGQVTEFTREAAFRMEFRNKMFSYTLLNWAKCKLHVHQTFERKMYQSVRIEVCHIVKALDNYDQCMMLERLILIKQ